MAVGEIQVGDLPTMTALDFTANDYIFIIDNGKLAKKISRPDFFSVVQALVKGEKGDVGATGATGKDGQQGAKGSAGAKGDVGATGAKGDQGLQGLQGYNGWSPILTSASDGDRRVMLISNWVGGTGVPPSTGQYVGGTGLVSDIALAVDFRGIQGLQGTNGTNGTSAKQINTLTILADGKVEITYSDATKTTSNSPSNKLGWASYKDTIYTVANKLNISANTTVVLPNNGGSVVESSLPASVTSLYNATNQKIQPSDNFSMFGVRLRFKVVNSGSVSEFINISLDKSTTDAPFSDDKIIRADTNPQTIDISTQIYSDGVTLTNGLTARIKTASLAVQIYDVEFVISKLT